MGGGQEMIRNGTCDSYLALTHERERDKGRRCCKQLFIILIGHCDILGHGDRVEVMLSDNPVSQYTGIG